MIADSRKTRRLRTKSVLMTADTMGGVWTFALALARALQPPDVHVTLAPMGEWMTHDQRSEARKVPNLEVFESRFRLEWMESPWDDVRRAGEWLLGLEQRLRPDVVHLNGYAHGGLEWRSPCMITAHSCVLSWWKAVRGEPIPAEWGRYQAHVQAGLQAASLVAAPTRAMLATLEDNYGPLRHKHVIPNARDLNRFAPGDKDRCILAAGRLWDEAKNMAAVDEVAPQLPWPVYLAGEDRHPNGSVCKRQSVKLLGRLNTAQMAHWYGRASIFCHPARYEPFGLCVLEAALSGCALVLGDIASLRENWEDAALFVPPDDRVALKQALLELINDEQLRAVRAAKACAQAITFTPEFMGVGYVGEIGR